MNLYHATLFEHGISRAFSSEVVPVRVETRQKQKAELRSIQSERKSSSFAVAKTGTVFSPTGKLTTRPASDRRRPFNSRNAISWRPRSANDPPRSSEQPCTPDAGWPDVLRNLHSFPGAPPSACHSSFCRTILRLMLRASAPRSPRMVVESGPRIRVFGPS